MEPTPSPYAPPSANLDPQRYPQSIAARVLGIFGRGLAYGLCIWLVFAFIYRPFLSQLSAPASSSDTSNSDKQQAEQARAYQEQLDKAKAMYDESERQQKRMGAVIAQQEAQVIRYDALLSAWERQAKVKQ